MPESWGKNLRLSQDAEAGGNGLKNLGDALAAEKGEDDGVPVGRKKESSSKKRNKPRGQERVQLPETLSSVQGVTDTSSEAAAVAVFTPNESVTVYTDKPPATTEHDVFFDALDAGVKGGKTLQQAVEAASKKAGWAANNPTESSPQSFLVTNKREKELLQKYGDIQDDQRKDLWKLMRAQGYSEKEIKKMTPIGALDIADKKGLITLFAEQADDNTSRKSVNTSTGNAGAPATIKSMEAPNKSAQAEAAVVPKKETLAAVAAVEEEARPIDTYAEKKKDLRNAVESFANREHKLTRKLNALTASAEENDAVTQEYRAELSNFRRAQRAYFEHKRDHISNTGMWNGLWKNDTSAKTAEGKDAKFLYDQAAQNFQTKVWDLAKQRLDAISDQEWERLQKLHGPEMEMSEFKRVYEKRKLQQAVGLVANHTIVREAGVLEHQVIAESFANRRQSFAEKALRNVGGWYAKQPKSVKYAIGITAGAGLALSGTWVTGAAFGVGAFATRKVLGTVGGAVGAGVGKWVGNVASRLYGKNKVESATEDLRTQSSLRGATRSSLGKDDILALLGAEDRIARAENRIKLGSTLAGAIIGGGSAAIWGPELVSPGVDNVTKFISAEPAGNDAGVTPSGSSESIPHTLNTSNLIASGETPAQEPWRMVPSPEASVQGPEIPPVGTQEPATTSFTVEVENGKGAIQSIQALKEQVAVHYPDPAQAPEELKHFLTTDAETLSKETGLYNSSAANESALIQQGSTFSLNEQGNLVLSQAGENPTVLTGESKFSGSFTDSNPAPRVEVPTPAPEMPATAPTETVTPVAPVESVSSAAKEAADAAKIKEWLAAYAAPDGIPQTIELAADQSPEHAREVAAFIAQHQQDPETFKALAKAAEHLEPNPALEQALSNDAVHTPHLYLLEKGKYAIFSNPDIQMSAADAYKLNVAAAIESAKETGQVVYVPYEEGREYMQVYPDGKTYSHGGIWLSPPGWMSTDHAVLEVPTDAEVSIKPAAPVEAAVKPEPPVQSAPVEAAPKPETPRPTPAAEQIAVSIQDRLNAVKPIGENGLETTVPGTELRDGVTMFKSSEWTKMKYWSDDQNIYVVGEGISKDTGFAMNKAEIAARGEMLKITGQEKLHLSGSVPVDYWQDPKTGKMYALMQFPKAGVR